MSCQSGEPWVVSRGTLLTVLPGRLVFSSFLNTKLMNNLFQHAEFSDFFAIKVYILHNEYSELKEYAHL